MNFIKNDQIDEIDELVELKQIKQIMFEIKDELKDILERLDVIEMRLGDYHE